MCPENSAAIGFSDDGLCLEIRDAKLLSSNILQKYFKHKNVSSFIRQLNNYGFKTIPVLLNSSVIHCFAHDYFRRDRMDLLEGVVRRGAGNETQKISDKLHEMQQRDNEFEHRLQHLKRANDQLLLQNHELYEENKRLKASWAVMQETFMRYPKQPEKRPAHVVNNSNNHETIYQMNPDYSIAPDFFPVSGMPLFSDEL